MPVPAGFVLSERYALFAATTNKDARLTTTLRRKSINLGRRFRTCGAFAEHAQRKRARTSPLRALGKGGGRRGVEGNLQRFERGREERVLLGDRIKRTEKPPPIKTQWDPYGHGLYVRAVPCRASRLVVL